MSPNFVISGSSSPSRKRRNDDEIIAQCSNGKISKEDGDFSDEDNQLTPSPSMDEDKRAHHNELERRRRDHIKDHFMTLKNSVPLLEGEKSSRAIILKRAVDYILILQSKVKEQQMEIEDLKKHNESLHKSMKLTAANEVLSSLVSTNAQTTNYRQMLHPTQMLKEESGGLNMAVNNVSVYDFQSQGNDSLKRINLNIPLPGNCNLPSSINSSSGMQPNVNDSLKHFLNINGGIAQQLGLINIQNNINKFGPVPSQSLPQIIPQQDMDLQTRLLANTLALREQRYAATISL
uniref:BHLH domain-containing protein n=1 Tax=Parastrongyloides trichosuri TaxID=131310 RepID=A0A0N4ZGM2_PARTI